MTQKNRHDIYLDDLANELTKRYGFLCVKNYAWKSEDGTGTAGEADILQFTPRGMVMYEVCEDDIAPKYLYWGMTYYEIKSNDTQAARKRMEVQRDRFFEQFDYMRDRGCTLHFVYAPVRPHYRGRKFYHWTVPRRGEDEGRDRH